MSIRTDPSAVFSRRKEPSFSARETKQSETAKSRKVIDNRGIP